MGSSLVLANMLAIWLESVLYGMYLVLFFYTLQVLHRQRLESRRTSWVLLTVCLVLVSLSTLHVVCSVRMLKEALDAGDTTPGGVNAYFYYEGTTLNVLRKGTYALSVLIADSLMLYRCFVLWNQNVWIIIFPILALCGTIISASLIAKELINYRPSSDTGIFTPAFNLSVPIFFAITALNSLYLAGCIVFKLWRASRTAPTDVLKFKRSLATIIVVESSSVYPLMNVIALIFFVAKTDMQAVPVNALAQVIAIAPTLLILQVQKGLYSPHSPSRLGVSSVKSEKGLIGIQEQFEGFATPYAFISKQDNDPKSPMLHKYEEGGVSYTTFGGTYPFQWPAIKLGSRWSRGITVTRTVNSSDAV